MKFTDLIESLLLEATPDEIYNSYYKDIPREEFNQVVMSDPQSKSNENGIQRIGKFAKLLINLYRKKTLKLEDLPRAKEYLDYVYKHSIALDSNKIKSLNDLYDLVKGYYAKDTRDLGSIISALDEKEYRKVFQNEMWTIFIPFTEKASCYLGVNTEWCTTWGPNSLNPKHQDRGSLYSRYHSQGHLYILIKNSDISEKYQFHFQSKQYMDKEDARINIREFLNNNEEVKHFFFPSLISDDVEESMLKTQIERLNALDDEDSSVLVNKLVSTSAKNNPIIAALISRDLDKLSEVITDNDLEPLDIDGEWLNVTFKTSYGGSLRTTRDTLSYYESEANDGREVLWDRLSNEDTDYITETLAYYLEEYYKRNGEELRESYGYQNYEQFKMDHYENFTQDDNIWDWYGYEYVNKNTQHFESAAQSYVDDIVKYVDFDSYTREELVKVKIPYFLLFLVKKDYQIIDGVNEYMIDVLDSYVSYYDIDNDYEGIWDHQVDDVKYEDLEKPITDYFEKVFTDFEGVKKCAEYRKKLNDVIQKVFKGSDRIENEEFSIYLPSMKIDCDKGTIVIVMNDKKKGTRESGPIKVDNLATYATNYKLFENVKNIKNLL
jgi:hypothetical protein